MESPYTTRRHVKPGWLILLVIPLVFFAVRGSFSFDYIGFNNAAVGNYGGLTVQDAGGGSLKHSIELILAYGTASAAMFMMLPEMIRGIQENLLVFFLPLYALLTTAWSQDRPRTLAFSLLAIINTAFGVYLARCLSPRQQLKLFTAVGFILAASSLALVIALPSAAVDHKNAMIGWQGIFPHKNICAIVMLSFVPAVLAEPFRGTFAGLRRGLCLGLILVLALGTTARTGWIVGILLIGGFYAFKLLRKVRPIERSLLAFSILVFTATTAWLVFQYMDEILHLMGKGSDLSGRTTIWRVVFRYLLDHPWFGSGYDAFWLGFKGDSGTLALQAGDPGLNNAENGILQLWLEVGVFGVLMLFAMFARTCKNAVVCFRSSTPGHVLWYLSILLVTLLALGDGDKFMFPNAIEWTMYIMADAALALEANRLRSPLTHWTSPVRPQAQESAVLQGW